MYILMTQHNKIKIWKQQNSKYLSFLYSYEIKITDWNIETEIGWSPVVYSFSLVRQKVVE